MSAEHLSASKPALQMTQLNYGFIFAMPYLYYAKAGPDGEMLPGNAGRERFSTAVSAADSSARKASRSRSLRPPPGCARPGLLRTSTASPQLSGLPPSGAACDEEQRLVPRRRRHHAERLRNRLPRPRLRPPERGGRRRSGA